MMGDTFEETYDWSILADHLGIEVTEEEVDEVIEKLKDKDLWINQDKYDSYDERIDKQEAVSIEELGMYSYQFRDDVERDIKLNKLENYLWELAFNVTEDMEEEYDQQDVDDIREFVNQHAEESFAMSGQFFKKLSEIDDDYLFLRYLGETVKDLWW